jgi:CelD/BcsL family acetyltransferase involved in cellulose biosynthesis
MAQMVDQRISPSVSFAVAPEQWRTPEVLERWTSLLADSTNPNALYQSPPWFENKNETRPEDRISLAVLRDETGRPAGFVPLVKSKQHLIINFKFFRYVISLHVMEVLGDQPLAPDGETDCDLIFTSIMKHYSNIDGIYMRGLDTASSCWRRIHESPAIREKFLLHVTETEAMHRLDLPRSFEAYLARFNSKHRNTLKRRVRILREHAGGSLELRRITAPQDVSEFLRLGGALAQRSWQSARTDYLICDSPSWHRHLSDLADRGLLRSYLLMCGPTPCAYVLGFQGFGGYQFHRTGYDPAFAQLAPGTVALYLLIEDLIRHDPPSWLSFEYGDQDYKRMFGTSQVETASVFLLRRTPRNRARRLAHAGYRGLVAFLKKRLRAGSR